MQATKSTLGQKTPPKQEEQESDFISLDAPPLDFSFKNIKTLDQLRVIQPRQGEKKKDAAEEKLKVDQKDEEKNQDEEVKAEKRKNEVTKLIPQNNMQTVMTSLVNASAMKNISMKAKEEMEKKKKKSIHVKLVCASLMLSYNKIRQLAGFHACVSSVMEQCANLQWIDISHNYLTVLDYDFKDYPSLKTLYMHCNYLSDLNQLDKVSHCGGLKTFTIHGNPLTAVPNFRTLTISILPQLKKLDSVLISKKEKDNAVFIRSQTKKFPLPKNIPKPPLQKQEEEEEEKD